uniref:hypothetical protein n=1 Tax=Agathobacter sp. TaxID=2021311 RepID=UPI004057C2DE
MKKVFNLIKNIIIVILAVALPILLVIWFVPADLLSVIDNRIDIVALAVSLYSLEMSVAIAFLIYWLETRDSKNEEAIRKQKARCMMYSELENALEGAYMRAAGHGNIATGGSTKDIMNTYLVELQDILTPHQFRLLISLVNKIDVEANDASEEEYRAATARKELIAYMQPWIAFLMDTKYAKYFAFVRDYRDALSKPVFDLLQVLSGANAHYSSRDVILDTDGNVLFRQKDNREYQIFDGSGARLLEGTFALNEYEEYAICDGYESSDTYDGFYKNGKYSGPGTLYSYDQVKLKEGIWEDGILVKGTEYNSLYEKQEDGSWMFYETYRDNIEPYLSLGSYIEDMSNFYVIDVYVEGRIREKKNIRKLEDFLSNSGRSY